MPRLYKFLEAKWALDDICRRRIKISQLADMNDPMELMSVQVKNAADQPDLDACVAQMNERFGALCFCRSWNNALLWAHYADKHRGICLGFDVTRRHAKRVNYITRSKVVERRGQLNE
ncbi:MAG: DUF2971 domain-containing protein [Acidobacteria bacterium]|nr:DUF2971 domain-containing protein [Acidobacteriota bacterium]